MTHQCKICGEPCDCLQDDDPCGACDECYYGMRLDPERWEARLKAKGIKVTYRGGCIPVGGGGIMCRDPYVAAPRLVKDETDG